MKPAGLSSEEKDREYKVSLVNRLIIEGFTVLKDKMSVRKYDDGYKVTRVLGNAEHFDRPRKAAERFIDETE